MPNNYFKPVQLAYTQNPAEAVLGMLAEGFRPYAADTRIARGFVRAGFGVFLSSGKSAPADPTMGTSVDPGEVFHVPVDGAGADVDAIHVTGASSASIQNITAFDGVIGNAEIQPPRQVTMVLSSHANWDATTAVITYVDENGATVSENLSIPDAGNATLTTVGKVRRVVSLNIPAQSGAAGTFTLGVVALASLTEALFSGVAIRRMFKRTLNDSALYGLPNLTGGPADYIDGEELPCLTKGGIYVASETAVADGDPVYIRTAVNGANTVLGAFANVAGTGRTLLNKARFKRSCAAPASAALFTPAWAVFDYL